MGLAFEVDAAAAVESVVTVVDGCGVSLATELAKQMLCHVETYSYHVKELFWIVAEGELLAVSCCCCCCCSCSFDESDVVVRQQLVAGTAVDDDSDADSWPA